MLLASLLTVRAQAIAYGIASAALVALAALLSHTQWQTSIDMSNPLIAIGGIRIMLIILFFNLLAIMVLDDSIIELFREVKARRKEVARLNQFLAQAQEEKQSWLSLLGHMHNEGMAIAWTYHSASGELQHTVAEPDFEQRGAAMARIGDAERGDLPAQSWQAKIFKAIDAAGMRPHSWKREIRCIEPESGEVRWYAVSADSRLAENSGMQVMGTLQDITVQRANEQA